MYIVEGQSAAGHADVFVRSFVNREEIDAYKRDYPQIKLAFKFGPEVFYIIGDKLFKQIITLIEKCNPVLPTEHPALFTLGLIKKNMGFEHFRPMAGPQNIHFFFDEKYLPDEVCNKMQDIASRPIDIYDPDVVRLAEGLLFKYSIPDIDKDDNVVVDTELKYAE